jgi:hypothetical protein
VEYVSLNAKVCCEDGVFGKLTNIILHPKTREVSHIVVKDRKPPHKEWLIPVDQIIDSSLDCVKLDCTRESLLANKPFATQVWVECDALQEIIPLPRGRMVPNRGWGKIYVQKIKEQIPPGEVAIHKGARVKSLSNDHENAKAVAFQIDNNSHRILNLIVQKGYPWRRIKKSIPGSQIKYFGDHTIYLGQNEWRLGAHS